MNNKITIVLNALGCTKLVDVDKKDAYKGTIIMPFIKHDRTETLLNLAQDKINIRITKNAIFKCHQEVDEMNRLIFYLEAIE